MKRAILIGAGLIIVVIIVLVMFSGRASTQQAIANPSPAGASAQPVESMYSGDIYRGTFYAEHLAGGNPYAGTFDDTKFLQ